MNPKCSIIVPALIQVHELLDEFVDHVGSFSQPLVHDMIVVCNRLSVVSPDELRRLLEDRINRPVTVVFDKERSVAGAWNKGIELSMKNGIERFLITAVDVRFTPSLVEGLIDFGNQYPQVDVWSSSPIECNHADPKGPIPGAIDACDFSCFMLTSRTIERHGWFDREYKPAYFEDNDYVTRVILGSGQIKQLLGVRHWHLGSLTIKRDPEAAHHVRHWFGINERRFKSKWGPRVDDHSAIRSRCHSTPFQSGRPLSWWPDQDQPGYSVSGGIHEQGNAVLVAAGNRTPEANRGLERERRMERKKLSFDTGGCLGDWLCMLSAAREYARRHPDQEVHIVNLFDVIEAYGDGLVKGGHCPDHHIYVSPVHREKHHSIRHNYLGTFLREICPEITKPMTLDLPRFAETAHRIALIQPYSGYAANPPVSYVQKMVDTFIETTGRTLYAVGHTSTKRDLVNVDYSLLEDSVPSMLRNISRADLVLTPRSASAHAAAGYGIPSFVWVPDDGENWHLDYPGWNMVRIEHKEGSDCAAAALKEFITTVLGPSEGRVLKTEIRSV